MTEEEWPACAELEPLLMFLRNRGSDRKRRLFACACLRGVWRNLNDEAARHSSWPFSFGWLPTGSVRRSSLSSPLFPLEER
jgi:hypothetical protein